jgi:hypothetical protein
MPITVARPSHTLDRVHDSLTEFENAKTLDNVTVTGYRKKTPMVSSQGAKPSFWDKVIGGVNKVTSRVQWGSMEHKASIDNNNLMVIGAIVLGVVLLGQKGRRR